MNLQDWTQLCTIYIDISEATDQGEEDREINSGLSQNQNETKVQARARKFKLVLHIDYSNHVFISNVKGSIRAHMPASHHVR